MRLHQNLIDSNLFDGKIEQKKCKIFGQSECGILLFPIWRQKGVLNESS